jgi:hypothetical protein
MSATCKSDAMKRVLTSAARSGFSFLELQVALLLLGIALAGMVPLVTMQSKQLKQLEGRFDSATMHYLAPSPSVWARKLGSPAVIRMEPPETTTAPANGEKVYDLNILSLTKSMMSETVGAGVELTPISE